MRDLTILTIESAINGLSKKEFSSQELTQSFIDKIIQKKNLNCFITETFDVAIKMAKRSDEKISDFK